MIITAFLDANVLYPAQLRNFFMRLALTGLFRARWSSQVHEEWITALLRVRPDLSRKKLEKVRDLMELHAQDAVVEGYEHLVKSITLPDPNDRHVLAAAIHGQANIIVTMNIRDFPQETLGPFGIEAQHPDDFVLQFAKHSPGAVILAAKEHRNSLKNPPKDPEDYLFMLEKHGLTQTVSILREFIHLI